MAEDLLLITTDKLDRYAHPTGVRLFATTKTESVA